MDEELVNKNSKRGFINPLSVSLISIAISVILVGTGIYMFLSLQNLHNDNKQFASRVSSLEASVKEVEKAELFTVEDKVNKDGFQAVFLDNGQTYFGNLRDGDLPGQVELTNIYYLSSSQTQAALPQGSMGNLSSADSASPQISLAKLGTEIHGPEDAMYISRDQMVFWENMKDESQIVTAIRNFEGE